MKPLDRRLFTRIGPTRRYLIAIVAVGVALALTVMAQALIIAHLMMPALHHWRADDGTALTPPAGSWVWPGIVWLASVVVLRVGLVWLQERLAHRAGARVITELRMQAVQHATTLGPRWIASGEGVHVTTLATRGLDALLPYFVRYLPSLVLAATVTPLALALVWGLDITSAIIITVTLPLVPLFMALIGRLTEAHSTKQLAVMQKLGAQVLDLISGLPTLRGFGREHGPASRVRELGERYRNATMKSLRVAFLSGMVLELLTTLSVALVAVTMGFRLVYGHIGIEVALAVLILAPEVYLPLRNVGTHFHASADGVAAADAAFAVLDQARAAQPNVPAPDLAGTVLSVSKLSVAVPDGTRMAPASLSLTAHAGSVTALRGPNGEGKSTALMALAGLLAPDDGTVASGSGKAKRILSAANGFSVATPTWSSQCAWVPQRPDLGPEGRSLSLGERQRSALEAAFSSGRPVLLLDEPTAHLDAGNRERVIDAMRAAADAGAIVVVATHDDTVMAAADQVVEVRGRAVTGVAR